MARQRWGLDTTLSWDSGGQTTSYDVYFGTSPTPTYRRTQTGRTFSPGELFAGTSYYWRVDAKNGQETTTGDLWWFKTALPGLSIADASVIEGTSGTRDMLFRVTLSAPSAQHVQAYIQTTGGGTAAHTVDYEWTTAWPLSFSPGETSKTFRVRVHGDTEVENDETFNVEVKHVDNATVVDGTATGTIINDDTQQPPPSPPRITRQPDPITFSSVDASSQTLNLADYITGATGYRNLGTKPTHVVSTILNGSTLTITPYAAGETFVLVAGINQHGETRLNVPVTVMADDFIVTFGTQSIPDITTTVDVVPDRVYVKLPLATGGDGRRLHLMRRVGLSGELGRGDSKPPGLSIWGSNSGERYLRGTATAAHDATTYTWMAVNPRDWSHVLAQLTFTVTISEGSYPVPRLDRSFPNPRVISIRNESSGGHNFHVGLPGHLGGKEPFRFELEPTIPGCNEMVLSYFYGGSNPNQFNCLVDQITVGTWTTTYTVTDVHGDSDSIPVTITFTP